MGCKHGRYEVESVVRVIDGAPLLELGVRCRDCAEPFGFVGVEKGISMDEPRSTPDGATVRLPLRNPQAQARKHVRCDRCSRLLVGRPQQPQATLHRAGARVSHIECGSVHVVHFSDGPPVRVGGHKMWIEDEHKSTAKAAP